MLNVFLGSFVWFVISPLCFINHRWHSIFVHFIFKVQTKWHTCGLIALKLLINTFNFSACVKIQQQWVEQPHSNEASKVWNKSKMMSVSYESKVCNPQNPQIKLSISACEPFRLWRNSKFVKSEWLAINGNLNQAFQSNYGFFHIIYARQVKGELYLFTKQLKRGNWDAVQVVKWGLSIMGALAACLAKIYKQYRCYSVNKKLPLICHMPS